jgi:hypothetical protein
MRARTYLMFSHTAKGQAYNTPLLSQFVADNPTVGDPLSPRLVDYEYLTDADGKRTVGFGWFAGGVQILYAPVRPSLMMPSGWSTRILVRHGSLSSGNWGRLSLYCTYLEWAPLYCC